MISNLISPMEIKKNMISNEKPLKTNAKTKSKLEKKESVDQYKSLKGN